MSLQRLRQVLGSVFTVQIDSSAMVVQRIQQQIDKRAQSTIAKGKTPPASKPPAIVATLATTISIDIRPVDPLRKIGDLTTPADVNMASLSASWATRRYFWAIAPPKGARPKFKLSQDARAMDFHQKTLLSDEFGAYSGPCRSRFRGSADQRPGDRWRGPNVNRLTKRAQGNKQEKTTTTGDIVFNEVIDLRSGR
jgi:hypothetical protein